LRRLGKSSQSIVQEAQIFKLYFVFGAIDVEPIEVKNTIYIRLENTLPIIAPLGNVVRKACSDTPGDPWHGGDDRIGREKKSRKGGCPYLSLFTVQTH